MEIRQQEVIVNEKLIQSRSHEEALIDSLRDDPEYAAVFLNSVLEDGDQEELLAALRYMSAAYGGVAGIAEKTEMNANTLYRTLSAKGNPELRTFMAILNAMGMRLAVHPKAPS
jgi:probable addiction module antidote protein